MAEGQGERVMGETVGKGIYLLIRIAIEFLVTYPREHLRDYLSCKHGSFGIYNFSCNFLLLPTLAIIPLCLQHNEPGTQNQPTQGKGES